MPRYAEKTMVKMNMELWLNNLFLTQGFYNTVDVGELDPYSTDMSSLSYTIEDPTLPLPGMVWQSYFKEWVHESGITPAQTGLAPPIIASGVYVNGTFYPKNSGAPGYSASYAHHIDYRNGRILFNSPISTTSTVQANFSYKDITVDFADQYEGEDRPLLVQTKVKDNPSQTGVISRPSYRASTLPLVLIDMRTRTSTGFELGDKSLIANFLGTLHVWSHDNMTKDMIEETLSNCQRDVIMGIDFNRSPFPLDSFGDKNGAFTSYGRMAQQWSPNFWGRIYLDEMSPITDQPLHGIDRSRVDFRALVYPLF